MATLLTLFLVMTTFQAGAYDASTALAFVSALRHGTSQCQVLSFAGASSLGNRLQVTIHDERTSIQVCKQANSCIVSQCMIDGTRMSRSHAQCDLQPMHTAVLQNALKIFKNMPESLMNIVKRTDPSTVTQHGLYMRPLTDPSLHPLVAKAPPAEAPGTPPNEEEQKPASSAEGCKPSEPATAQDSIQPSKTDEQPGAQEADMASADAAPVLQKETENLNLGNSNPKSSPKYAPTLHAQTSEKPVDSAADAVTSDAKLSGSPAEMNGTSLPTGAPAPVGKSSVSTGSTGTASVPMGNLAPVGVPSATKGTPNACDASPETNAGSASVPGKGQETPRDEDVCWGRGRVSLLGDAAHATIPNGMSLSPLCP